MSDYHFGVLKNSSKIKYKLQLEMKLNVLDGIVIFFETLLKRMFGLGLVWFLAGNQGNHQNFDPFCGLLRIYELYPKNI